MDRRPKSSPAMVAPALAARAATAAAKTALAVAVAVALAVTLAGCTDEPPPPPRNAVAPRPDVPVPAGTWLYDCGRDVTFLVLADGDDAVRIVLPEGTVRLQKVVTPTSTRYEAEGYTLWLDGKQARLQSPQTVYVGCDSKPELALWEDARRRGVELLAAGYAPNWRLEFLDDRLVMVAGKNSRHEFPRVEPEVDGEGSSRTYHCEQEGREMVVTIMDRPSQDAATCRQMPLTVVAELEGRTYRGWGRKVE
ncbi:MAG: MliC family protein [Candidatus Krumholzibacteriia bacterium]